ncbi:MAG: HD domain-containing protein, partial [bacterium]
MASEADGRPGSIALPPPSAGSDLGATAREYLLAVREAAGAWHHAGGGGTDVVDYFTASIDSLICFLAEAASHTWRQRYVQGDEEIAVLAQGGYGRAELNPWSDIDLLILHPHKVTPYAEATTETILYALWDARLQVGHAVRNVRDCVRLAAADLKIKTSLLDARFLCGGEDIAKEFERALDREISARGAARFFREKVAESEQRHRELGESVYLLVPQIKEGRGGLRDLHTALWLAKVQFKIRDIRELAHKAVLAPPEIEAILEARDFLFRVRNSLHFLTSSHSDQLTFELQDQVAEDLGYGHVTPEAAEPVENFLRDYYRKASVITRFSEQMIERVVNPSQPYRLIGKVMARTIRPGVQILNNEMVVPEAQLFVDDPVEMLRVVRDAQRHGVALASSLTALLRANAHRFDQAARDDPRVPGYFMAILRSPWRVYETVHDLHRHGLLERILPEWEHLVCLVRRNHFHIYTVDEHSLMGIREIERLRRGEWAESLPLLTQVMREVEDVGLLFLAMMLHDIGKGTSGDHSEAGSKMAEDIGRRLGLDEDACAELLFLVRNHLVLPLFAEQRDLNDEKTAMELARIVGTPESLQRLFL